MFDFMSGWFDEIRGLPLHPLVVHAVVVLVPISAIGMVVAMAVPRWRSPLQWYALVGLGVGAVGTYLAKISGDSLSAAVGLPTDHANLIRAPRRRRSTSAACRVFPWLQLAASAAC